MAERYAPGPGLLDIVVLIPKDEAGGSYEQRVVRAVKWLWSRGIYPGPAAVSLRLHGRATRSINGKETKIRNRLMRELEIPRQRKYYPGQWELPAETPSPMEEQGR